MTWDPGNNAFKHEWLTHTGYKWKCSEPDKTYLMNFFGNHLNNNEKLNFSSKLIKVKYQNPYYFGCCNGVAGPIVANKTEKQLQK